MVLLSCLGSAYWIGKAGSTYIHQISFIPRSIAVDRQGNIYVFTGNLAASNYQIEKLNSHGQFIARWGSYGKADGQLSYQDKYKMGGTAGLVLNVQNDVFVVDEGNNRIQKFDANGNFLTKWGSYGTSDGQFETPVGIAVDKQSNVYVADTGNSRVQKFDANGNFLTKWGHEGGNDGEFEGPTNLAVDKENNVYVVDSRNFRIEKFDANGNFLGKWGGSDKGFEEQFGSLAPGSNTEVVPVAISIDTQDNIYLADSGMSRVVFGKEGKFERTRFSLEVPKDKIYDDNIIPIENLAIDEQGNLYVAKGYYIPYAGGGITDFDGYNQEYYNPHVHKFDKTGGFLATYQPNVPPYKGVPLWVWLLAPLIGVTIGGIVTTIIARRRRRKNTAPS